MSRLFLVVFVALSVTSSVRGYRPLADHERTNEGVIRLKYRAANDNVRGKEVSPNMFWWPWRRETPTCPGLTVVEDKVSFSKIGDTSSCPVRPWTPEQTAARERNVTVSFGVTFLESPVVSLSLTKLDANKDYNLRFDIDVTDITKTGCIIMFKTWCNTYVYTSVVSYTATGYED